MNSTGNNKVRIICCTIFKIYTELGNFVMLVVITDSITQSARNENFFIPAWFFANFIVMSLRMLLLPRLLCLFGVSMQQG